MTDEAAIAQRLQEAYNKLAFYQTILQQVSFAPRNQAESLEDRWDVLKKTLSTLVNILHNSPTPESANKLVEYAQQFIQVNHQLAQQKRPDMNRFNHYVNAIAQCTTWLTVLDAVLDSDALKRHLRTLRAEANYELAKAYYKGFKNMPKNVEVKLLMNAAQSACSELLELCYDDSQFCTFKPKLAAYLVQYFKIALAKQQGAQFLKFLTSKIESLPQTAQRRLYLHAVRIEYYRRNKQLDLADSERSVIKNVNTTLLTDTQHLNEQAEATPRFSF